MPASSLEAVEGKKYKTHNPAFVLCCVCTPAVVYTLSIVKGTRVVTW